MLNTTFDDKTFYSNCRILFDNIFFCFYNNNSSHNDIIWEDSTILQQYKTNIIYENRGEWYIDFSDDDFSDDDFSDDDFSD